MSHNSPLQVEVDIFGGRVKLRRFMSHIVHSKEIRVNQLRTVKKYDQQSALGNKKDGAPGHQIQAETFNVWYIYPDLVDF